MRVVDILWAQGHPLVRAMHPTTLEVTKHPNLTSRGDCIIAVQATKAAMDLSNEFKTLASSSTARVTLTVAVAGYAETIRGRGHPSLTFTHPTDLVARKSSHICPRTVMVHADRAAADLPREFTQRLRDPKARVKVSLEAKT